MFIAHAFTSTPPVAAHSFFKKLVARAFTDPRCSSFFVCHIFLHLLRRYIQQSCCLPSSSVTLSLTNNFLVFTLHISPQSYNIVHFEITVLPYKAMVLPLSSRCGNLVTLPTISTHCFFYVSFHALLFHKLYRP